MASTKTSVFARDFNILREACKEYKDFEEWMVVSNFCFNQMNPCPQRSGKAIMQQIFASVHPSVDVSNIVCVSNCKSRTCRYNHGEISQINDEEVYHIIEKLKKT